MFYDPAVFFIILILNAYKTQNIEYIKNVLLIREKAKKKNNDLRSVLIPRVCRKKTEKITLTDKNDDFQCKLYFHKSFAIFFGNKLRSPCHVMNINICIYIIFFNISIWYANALEKRNANSNANLNYIKIAEAGNFSIKPIFIRFTHFSKS